MEPGGDLPSYQARTPVSDCLMETGSVPSPAFRKTPLSLLSQKRGSL